jgi:hypothetical protein
MDQQPWYVAERAKSLAIVRLTTRIDLDVIPVDSGGTELLGYDLLVKVKGYNQAPDARFGVEVKGKRTVPESIRPLVRLMYSPMQLRVGDLPVCIFLFSAKSDEGFYRWLAEPVIESRIPRLHLNEEFAYQAGFLNDSKRAVAINSVFTKLTDDEIDAIVHRVVRWFEARRNHQII